ncbi:GvpL/GvpF family gas vesicle protein [Leptolyngbya sp. PCC 6406]|uniref:GvpL/GvpF family gas vesicle protein n=1 Tax=Leptolyngbya sp. PCC 6406 TaxID=1173264 RepID=UPI0002ABBE3B|nr:GvpL/GvpF family gas vesicle protein [Leptolyngbya sp. PCC 6406]
MIYVYGFCPTPVSPWELPEGIANPTTLITVGAVAAIAELDLDVSGLKTNDQQLMTAVLSHDRVLQDLFAQTDVLPLRFGTQFSDPTALRSYLEQNGARHGMQLAQLRGKAEYRVELTPKSLNLPPLATELKGREYFAEKKRRLQVQGDYQRQQDQELAALIDYLQRHGQGLHLGTAQDGLERLYLLGSRQSEAVDADLAEAGMLAPGWTIHRSVPLPPYHFIP